MTLEKISHLFTEEQLDSLRATYIERFRQIQRETIERYKRLNKLAQKGQILFTGSSLMEQFPVNELAQGITRKKLYNRGVGGFTSFEFIENLDVQLFELAPTKIFLNIGTNDLSMDGDVIGKLCENYKFILGEIVRRLPDSQTFVMAFYPMNEEKGRDFGCRTNERIQSANEAIRALVGTYQNVTYIDVNDGLCDKNGQLKAEWTMDGVHMIPDAYASVLERLAPYLE